MYKQRTVIFINGTLPDGEQLRRLLKPQDHLVAVDGGLRHVLALGMTPHWLIGDLDSVDPLELAALEEKGVEIRRFSPRKDQTDLQLALQAVADSGCRRMLLVAALGERIDHTLGNLYLLTHPAFAELDIRVDDGITEGLLIRSFGEVRGTAGDLVSLIPVEAKVTGVTTQGLEYPLENETLLRHEGRGISNVMLGDKAGVTIEDGLLFCIHTRQQENFKKKEDQG